MTDKRAKKFELNGKEREYLSSLIEAQRCAFELLSDKQRGKDQIRNELKITERLEKKLAF